MQAVVFAGEGQLEVRELPRPGVEGPDDVIIRVAANGICGSDLRALSTPPQMVYEPEVVIGHEFVGEIAEVGAEVTDLAIGDRVTAVPNINCQVCWYCRSGHLNLCENFVHIGSMRNGGAAEYVSVPQRLVVPIPDGLSDRMATLTEPLACVLNGTRAAAVHPGETVLVLGGGPIGLLYTMIFKAAGARVVVSEPSEHRARLAAAVGADVVLDPGDGDIPAATRELTDGRGADVCVESVGMLLGDAIRAARKGGKVLVFGVNERAVAEFAVTEIVYSELHLHGVYIAKGTFPLAVELLTRNEIGFDRLLTHDFGFADAMQAVETTRSGEAVKTLLVPA